MNYTLNMAQTKQVQKKLLEIYKEIKRVCDKNKIPFFAIAGTALGAVRHGGFIPWDDDVDLGVKASDFERFKKACKKDLKGPYEFRELPWIGGKVHDKTTTFIEAPGAMHRENGYGVFIDIFPLIGVPNEPNERFGFMNNMTLFYFQAMLFDRYPEATKYTKAQILEWRESLMTKCDLEESEAYTAFADGYTFTQKTEGLKKPVEMPFEDTTVLIPSTYDADLTAQYGDYMVLPPEEQRHEHGNLAYVDLKAPYTDYYDKLERLDSKLLEFLKRKHGFEGEAFLNSALFMTDGNTLRRELKQIKNSKAYKIAEKMRKVFK